MKKRLFFTFVLVIVFGLLIEHGIGQLKQTKSLKKRNHIKQEKEQITNRSPMSRHSSNVSKKYLLKKDELT